jgi:hypothetical protein
LAAALSVCVFGFVMTVVDGVRGDLVVAPFFCVFGAGRAVISDGDAACP